MEGRQLRDRDAIALDLVGVIGLSAFLLGLVMLDTSEKLGFDAAQPLAGVLSQLSVTLPAALLVLAATSLELATGLVLARDAGGGWWRGALVAIAIGLAATSWAGGVVQPRARRLRAAMQAAGESSPEAAAFRRLHGRAVALNAAALLAALVGLGCSAAAVRS